MRWPLISVRWLRFLRQQELYIVIAVTIYAIFWAIRPEAADAATTLVYTLFLCNFTALWHQRLRFLYDGRKPAQYWLILLLLIAVLTPIGVLASILLVYRIQSFGMPFLQFAKTSWKFPLVATFAFAISWHVYRTTRTRLERHNRELQKAVEAEVAQRELQEQELQRAREIQQSLLPKDIPQLSGFEIAGAWEPARVVGGDYFDVIKLGDTKVGICIADVVGKSVSAALLMANVQATVRAFASEATTPAQLCTRVNSVLCNNIASGKFVTLFYGVLDANGSRLQFTNAGHLRPVLIKSSGALEELDNGGALLGVFPTWSYEDSSLQFTSGDRLILFTDGITEAMNGSGEEFGEHRLMQAAKELRTRPASELNAELLQRVKAFCNAQLHDDATLIVIAART